MFNQKLELLISLNTRKAELEEQISALKEELVDQLPDEWYVSDWFKVNRISKNTFKLVGISESECIAKFPMACKAKPDMAELKKLPEAHQYLTVEKMSYIQITKVKDGGN